MKYHYLICTLPAIAIAACSVQEDPGESADLSDATTSESVAIPRDRIPATTIEVLAGEYAANEYNAQKKWEGQPFFVTGTVDEIDLDFSDQPVVIFASDEFIRPSLSFDPDFQDDASQLQKGQRFTFLCREISEVMGSPMVSACTLDAVSSDIADDN